MQGSPETLDDFRQEILVRTGRATNDYALLGGSHLLHLFDRNQEELAPETPAAHFEHVWLVDPREEANSLDEPDRSGWRGDLEALTPGE